MLQARSEKIEQEGDFIQQYKNKKEVPLSNRDLLFVR